MSDQHPLLEAYLNGELDDQGYIDLNAWLREDPEHLRQFTIASFLAQELGEALIEQAPAAEHAPVTDRASATQRGVMDAELLSLLQQIEDSANAETVTLVGELPNCKDPGSLSGHDFVALSGYVLRKALTAKPVIYTGITTAAAAVLLLALIIINPFASDTPDPLASGPIAPAPSAGPPAVQAPPVATLTATHKAQWAQGALAPGSRLEAGQRLTLTAGFAEITTNRGAVLTLQAPCQIDLSDDDNLLRLQRGKLFAAVSPAATGFTVDTPTARVVDIGTEFGVDVDRTQATLLQVYKGEVRAASVDSDGSAGEFETLYTEQAATIDPDAGLQRIAFDPGLHEQGIHLAHLRPTFHARPVQKHSRREMWWRGEMTQHLVKGREKSETLQAFIEKAGVLLQQDVQVDLNDPGRRIPNDPFSIGGKVVEAGKRVDVYLLHFDPQAGPEGWDKGFFKVTFHGKILGIACHEATIAGLDRALGLGPDRYPIVTDEEEQGGRGLELAFGDAIKIIPEGNSLELTSNASTHYDQILVLVESDPAKEVADSP